MSDGIPKEKKQDQKQPDQTIRVLPKSENRKARAFWKEVFTEDSDTFLDYYDACMADHNCIYVNEENGVPIAMLQRNPYQVMICGQERALSYIVAVATKETYRHQGRMQRLLKRALEDCRKKQDPFVYLMPASEKIYEPFGFRTVASQNTIKPDQIFPGEDRYVCKRAEDDQLKGAAALSEKIFSENCGIYAKRDPAYFSRIQKEQKAMNGGVLLLYEKDRLAGYCLTGEEDGVEVWELLIDTPQNAANYASALRAVTTYFSGKLPITVSGLLSEDSATGRLPENSADGERSGDAAGCCAWEKPSQNLLQHMEERLHTEITYRPITMVRIVDLSAFVQLLRAKREIRRTIRIEDAFLPKNSGVYELVITPEYGRLTPVPVQFAQDTESTDWKGNGSRKENSMVPTLTIEEFTDAVFGIRESLLFHKGEELQSLRPVYLRELI